MRDFHTPFSTRLSGNAKETELRLRNIFQWKKGRPPVVLAALVLVLALGCGGLVACRPGEKPADSSMDYNELALPLVQRTIDDELDPDVYEFKTLWTQTGRDRTLVLAQMLNGVHAGGMDDLFLGVWDEDKQEFTGESYVIRGDASAYSTWQGKKGETYLLWSNNVIYNDQENSSGLGCFRFDGAELERVTELPQPALDCGLLDDLPDAEQMLNQGRDSMETGTGLWPGWVESCKAIPLGAGFELLTAAPDMEGDRWKYLGYVPFAYISDQKELAPVRDLVQAYSGDPIYCLGEDANGREKRIDMFAFVGQVTEDDGAVLQTYLAYPEEGMSPYCVVLECGPDGQPVRVSGTFQPDERRTTVIGAKEVYYGVDDLHMAFFRDGSAPISWRSPMEGETVEVWEGAEPIYRLGDYWAWHRAEDLTALCYHSKDEYTGEERYRIHQMETTRPDLRTYDGIRVGDSRKKVENTYGTYLHKGAEKPYWDYQGDYLWYNGGSDDVGETLIFWFEGDTVSKLEMSHMFN